MGFASKILKRLATGSGKKAKRQARAPDPFELRLKRIGAREARVAPHRGLFIQPLQLQED